MEMLRIRPQQPNWLQTMKVSDSITLKSTTRIGKANPRTVLVKLQNVSDKGKVSNLKDVKNSKDKLYYVNNQLTPKMQDQERKYRSMIKYNTSFSGTGKRDLSMKKGDLLADGHPFRPVVTPPSVQDSIYPTD